MEKITFFGINFGTGEKHEFLNFFRVHTWMIWLFFIIYLII